MTAAQFLDAVLQLRPSAVVFDCDGTLWAPDAGERFLRWEIREQIIPGEVARWVERRYADYLDGKVDEDTMCGEMVTIHAGLPVSALAEAAARFFAEDVEPHIFPAMRDLVARLRQHGADVWAVSSTNEWIIHEGMKRFAIPPDRVLAAQVAIEHGRATSRLLQVPSGPGKPRAIRRRLDAQLDAAFGNSIWDREMLMMARHPFAINPNPDLERVARALGWPVFWPKVELASAAGGVALAGET